MTPPPIVTLVVIAVLTVCFVLGLNSTWWLAREYRKVRGFIQPNRRAIGLAFVVVSGRVLVALFWFSILTAIRAANPDAEMPAVFPVVSTIVSVPVLLIPVYLKGVWKRVASAPMAKKL